jgi:hypothetical protein
MDAYCEICRKQLICCICPVDDKYDLLDGVCPDCGASPDEPCGEDCGL